MRIAELTVKIMKIKMSELTAETPEMAKPFLYFFYM